MDSSPLGDAYAVPSDDHITVFVTGEIDMLSTPHLDDVLAAAVRETPGRVEIDLERVEFLASTGLRSLVTAKQLADDEGVGFKVVRPSDVARRVLELSALDSLLAD